MDTTSSRSETAQRAALILDHLASHVSVRRYSQEPVPADDVRRVIQSAQRAATSSNLQLWSVVVSDGAERARIAELCGNQRHVAEAPLFLTWCADRSRLDRVSAARGYDQVTDLTESFLVAAIDAAIAAQNAAVAAEALGYGICYIGGLRNNPDLIAEMLGLPPLVMPVFGMTLGRPAETALDGVGVAAKPRLETEVVLHWGRYRTDEASREAEAAAIARYDEVMRATGIYDGRQVADPRTEATTAEVARELYGWSEHSARRAATRSRERLRSIIGDRGFPLK